MSTTEAIIQKLSGLPPEKQEKELQCVEALTQPARTADLKEPGSSLRAVTNLKLDGPRDGSKRFHQNLYGENVRDSN
jgi:hypothetical protein